MSSPHNRIHRLQHRLQSISTIAEYLKLVDQRFFWYRLTAFLGAWVFAILTRFLFPGLAWIWVLIAMVILFLIVVFYHRRLDHKRQQYQNAQDWLTQQIARATLDWTVIPEIPMLSVDPDHAYMNDLNLVGDRSILQLIDTCSSLGGRSQLQKLFLWPDKQVKIIIQRQSLVKELLVLTGFRTRMMLLGWQLRQDFNDLWDDHVILRWLENKTQARSLKRILLLLSSLAALNYILLALNFLAGWAALWQFSFLLYFGIYFYQYRLYQSTFQDAYQLSKNLQPLQNSLIFLETYPAKPGSRLAEQLSIFKKPGQKPSAFLKKIIMISSAASLQNNQILSLLVNALLPWDMIFTYILDRTKDQLKQHLPSWLNVWYELEAINALANFAYLNPDYGFPIIESKAEVLNKLLRVQGVGHPLIPKQEKVVNDFSLVEKGDVALISGSNMSGKSTFLRTLGVNLVLAYAGTVVNAIQMNVSMMRLFTCIQVSDSLKDGFSYFYAEVRRLKELLVWLEDSNPDPVFYLIDEIFQGTNHEERRIGSLAYLKAIVNANGIGAISTHDIELSKLADEEIHIQNYNFQDAVVEGKMSFDYCLRHGPSPTTNALKIMELEGLPVNPYSKSRK
jgi:ABC-type multidrug transport system fused ATPase/permease subunit